MAAVHVPLLSEVMGTARNGPGEVVVALRQKRVAMMEAGDSSSSAQVMVTDWPGAGISGRWRTLLTRGATLSARTLLTAPGVAPVEAVPGSQFWPLLLEWSGLMSSSEAPPPLAAVTQSQPLKVDSRTRWAQSPSLAYVTSSTVTRDPAVVPGMESRMRSPLLARPVPGSHGPRIPVTLHWVETAVGLAAMTR